MRLRLGTRPSGLARAHASMATDRLSEASSERGVDLEVVVVPVTAEGDLRHERSTAADAGVLMAALRVSLLSGECDFVVHPLEDVPVVGHPDLSIEAILKRLDARDALCTGGPLLAAFSAGVRVAADSPRRTAQALALRPGLKAVESHGRLDFQLERLSGGEFEGLILGQAALDAIGRTHSAVQVFELDEVVPAAGQGALVIETRTNAPEEFRELLRAIDDPATRAAAIAERSVLEVLDAGKDAPVGAHATVTGGLVKLHVRVLNRDGTLTLNDFSEGPLEAARALGRNAGLVLLGRGAARLLRS